MIAEFMQRLQGMLGVSDTGFLVVLAFSLFSILSISIIVGGWLERKVIARVHTRLGPTYTGPFGALQTVADGVKFLRKELIFPRGSDRMLFTLAPILMLVPSFLAFLFIPLGNYTIVSSPYSLVLVLALLTIGPLAILVGSWASNSKYSTLGGLRAAGMTMSYEALVALAAASVALSAGSLDLEVIVSLQEGAWFAVRQPVAFVLFAIGIVASVERNPFDLVEAESELVSGWKTEYGGVLFVLTLFAEYVKLFASMLLFTSLFLGGWSGPLAETGYFLKAAALVFLMFVLRATAMRLRLDQVFSRVWLKLIPLGLLNFIATVAILEVLR